MKQVLLAAILAAVVASGVTLLVAGPAHGPPALPPAAPDPAVAELRSELDATRAELAELRQRTGSSTGVPAASFVDLARGTSGLVVPGSGAGTAVAGTEAQPQEAVAVEAAAEPLQESDRDRLDREFAAKRPAAQQERIRDAATWDDSPETRSRWILLPEAEVVATFGKPDNIWVQESGVECWAYRVPSTERDENGNLTLDDITVTLNRGRLVRVDD